MKKKNDNLNWKEGLIVITITLLVAGLIGWGLYTKMDKINKTCSEKITELKGFENCKYVDWEPVGDHVYKCICIENNELKDFAITRDDTKICQ